MQLRIGYELIYSFPQPTPIILVVNVHDSRASDIVVPDRLTAEPAIPIAAIATPSETGATASLRLRAASALRPTG